MKTALTISGRNLCRPCSCRPRRRIGNASRANDVHLTFARTLQPRQLRLISSSPSPSPSPPTPPSSPAHITTPPHLQRLQTQQPKVIRDYLTPMPSHLLTIMLSDLTQCDGISTSSSAVDVATSKGRLVSSTTAAAPQKSLHSETASSVSSLPVIQSPPAPLPQGHHLVYFPIQTAPSRLAPDGADLDHSPGPHYSRRLWAGGEVTFGGVADGIADGLLLDGRPWTCTETIGDVRVKSTGTPSADTPGDEKVFVDVWRRYALGHPSEEKVPLPWSIEERRTLAFMNPGANATLTSASGAKTLKYPHEPAHSTTIRPSPRHLFHFSALTFNAHAIHLDPKYARSVDGHRAPLVHGPLTLALMLRALTTHTRGRQLVSRFVYRNHAPLYVDEPLTVKLRPLPARRDDGAQSSWDVWVEGPDGGLAVKGTAVMVDRVEDDGKL